MVFVPYNGLVVFSSIGYHYLIDVIAALFLTVICWYYIRRKFCFISQLMIMLLYLVCTKTHFMLRYVHANDL